MGSAFFHAKGAGIALIAAYRILAVDVKALVLRIRAQGLVKCEIVQLGAVLQVVEGYGIGISGAVAYQQVLAARIGCPQGDHE